MASALEKLIGETVVNGESKDVTVSSLGGEGKVLGIYFSAHWCPPCRAFTPQLATWYNNFKKGPNGDKFEIVFVSSDRDDGSFQEYFKEMPWLALPYKDRTKKTELSQKYKVTGIPTLVFLNSETAQLITSDGRSAVMEDPEGKEFPWLPKPFTEIIKGKLINSKKEESDWDELKGKVIGLYFSAHWCGPCRVFTPQLVESYKKLKEAGKNFEIIFASSDRDEDSMMEYLGEMPWLAIPYNDTAGRKKLLSRLFEVSGIPTLILIDEEGKVITTQGRGAVTADPTGKDFPWHPKPVNEMTGATAAAINDHPSLIWFTDGEPANMEEAKKVLLPIAEEYIAKCKEEGTDQDVVFFYGGDNDDDDIVQSLRLFAKISTTNPHLAILDIPEQKVYSCDATSITDKEVRDFLEQFVSKSIEGRPIRA